MEGVITMKKKIALIALCLLVIAAIGLVIYYYYDRLGPQLSKDQKEAIGAACTEADIAPVNFEAKDRTPGAVRYYGNYEGYDVFLLFPENFEVGSNVLICLGNREFYCPVDDCKFYAYKENTVYSVKDLYSSNVFSNEVIEKLWLRHRKYNNRLLIDGTGQIVPAG